MVRSGKSGQEGDVYMIEGIREWLSQIVCFLCLMTLLLHVIPDTGMKRYVRFFLGILFLMVVMEPLGKLAGGKAFFVNFELESMKGLRQIYESGKMGLEDTIEGWDEESYQQELQKKIEEIYDTYHIPQQETHNNNQKTGVENGETGISR